MALYNYGSVWLWLYTVMAETHVPLSRMVVVNLSQISVLHVYRCSLRLTVLYFSLATIHLAITKDGKL